MKRSKAPRKISAKKLKALGGKMPSSTITAKRKPIARGKPPKRSTKPIKAKGKRRFPKGEDRKFLAWIRTLPCHLSSGRDSVCHRYPTEAAHVRSKGAGGHDKGNVIPLCALHHREQHTIGIRSFVERYRSFPLDLPLLAERYGKRYEREHPVALPPLLNTA